MVYNKIQVAFGALKKITGPPLQWQYNEKQTLIINGLDLPEFYEVDFCNKGDADTITMPNTENGVEIPDQFLLTGRPLIAYIVVVDGESVNTIGEITFPVNVRGRRTDISPEPAEQQQIDSLIATLNNGVSRADYYASNAGLSASAAREYARQAEEQKNNARSYANNALASSLNANRSAETASRAATTATTQAGIATTKAEEAEGSATAASQSATQAEEAAERAEQSAAQAGYMYFYIDEHGDLIYQHTSNVQVDFYLSDGDLYVKAVA